MKTHHSFCMYAALLLAGRVLAAHNPWLVLVKQ
jgi:hypothetical protein